MIMIEVTKEMQGIKAAGRTSKPNQLMPLNWSTLPSMPMMLGPDSRMGVSAASAPPLPMAEPSPPNAAPPTLTRMHLRPFWKMDCGTRSRPAAQQHTG